MKETGGKLEHWEQKYICYHDISWIEINQERSWNYSWNLVERTFKKVLYSATCGICI